MKNILLLFISAFFCLCELSAAEPVLRFGDDGKFKIAQFTDTHIAIGEGTSDYRRLQVELKVQSSKDSATSLVLYCMDSHDYSTIKGVDGYGWFNAGQIEWLRNSCIRNAKKNGGAPVPSLAFFHICLQEYSPAWDDKDNSRTGRSAEDECPGALNTGMFAAMVETGSVMGTFVGHDHDNDYVVAQNGIALGYGRYSGDDSTYNNLRPGARLIVVEEGKQGFESWILEDDGRIVDHMSFKEGRVID